MNESILEQLEDQGKGSNGAGNDTVSEGRVGVLGVVNITWGFRERDGESAPIGEGGSETTSGESSFLSFTENSGTDDRDSSDGSSENSNILIEDSIRIEESRFNPGITSRSTGAGGGRNLRWLLVIVTWDGNFAVSGNQGGEGFSGTSNIIVGDSVEIISNAGDQRGVNGGEEDGGLDFRVIEVAVASGTEFGSESITPSGTGSTSWVKTLGGGIDKGGTDKTNLRLDQSVEASGSCLSVSVESFNKSSEVSGDFIGSSGKSISKTGKIRSSEFVDSSQTIENLNDFSSLVDDVLISLFSSIFKCGSEGGDVSIDLSINHCVVHAEQIGGGGESTLSGS